ncbi:hypothetical protein [Stappia sp.]|uniref:hypothetical protein n=1 Tax=Stappia sp. TaxID=1870903 RepID=UPI0032D8B773
MSRGQAARFAERTAFERHYVKHLSENANPVAILAFNATPPVKRKFPAGARGAYRADGHYIVAPARFEAMPDGAIWVGVFAHEMGHAIDLHGRPADQGGRSIWLAPAIRRDRDRIGERWVAARSRVAGEGREMPEFPPAAHACLLALIADRREARRVARQWRAGRMEEALAALIRARRGAPAGRSPACDPRLQIYGFAVVGAFIGAVYDLARGSGPPRAYYRRFRHLGTPTLTIAHAAEAFANAYVADVLEGTELLSFLVRTAAPHTHAAYRVLLARIAARHDGAT